MTIFSKNIDLLIVQFIGFGFLTVLIISAIIAFFEPEIASIYTHLAIGLAGTLAGMRIKRNVIQN